MERPMGIEPTPIPWQGIVLPLNYGRFALPEEGSTFIAWLSPRVQAAPARAPRSIDFHDPRAPHHGRFFLARGKSFRFSPVNVNAGKLLAVAVEHGHLPVVV